jgi:hypothetical protein
MGPSLLANGDISFEMQCPSNSLSREDGHQLPNSFNYVIDSAFELASAGRREEGASGMDVSTSLHGPRFFQSRHRSQISTITAHWSMEQRNTATLKHQRSLPLSLSSMSSSAHYLMASHHHITPLSAISLPHSLSATQSLALPRNTGLRVWRSSVMVLPLSNRRDDPGNDQTTRHSNIALPTLTASCWHFVAVFLTNV